MVDLMHGGKAVSCNVGGIDGEGLRIWLPTLLMVSSGVGGMRMPYMTLLAVLIGVSDWCGALVQEVLFPGITKHVNNERGELEN